MFAIIKRCGAYFFFVGILLSIGTVLSAQNADSKTSKATDTQEVLASVGDTKLTKEILDREIEGMGPAEKAQFSTPEGRKHFIKQWIDVTLLEKEAEKTGLANGEDKKQSVQELTTNIISQRFLMKKMEGAKVPEADIAEYYKKNEKDFSEPEKYHLFQITANDATDSVKIADALKEGKTFLEVAKKFSSDPFGVNGGDRSFVSASELPEAAAKSLATLNKDEVSKPIDLEEGKKLFIKYTEKNPSQIRPIAEVTDEIKKILSEGLQNKVMDELKKEVEFKLEEKSVEILKKEVITPEELEKSLFTVGSKTYKVNELAAELERVPPMFRAQLIDDFMRQFSTREVVKAYVEKHSDELRKEFPDSENDAKKRIGIRMLLDEKIGNAVKLSEDEIKDFYSKNLTSFARPAQTRARHILVDEEAKAKELAEKASKESFEELAKANSKCPSSKEGGDLGFFAPGQMVPEFDSVAQTAEIGKVVGPIKTKFGYHLIKVEERKASGTAALDEVKDKIRSKLLPEKQKAAFDQYLSELKKVYTVSDFSDK
ncbi:MAG: peptidyl-prolyl cis-trans isomerase [Candidatus Riflebacteria bacterium]|nr:peptidyl-prolyl cis-trans isomerase [Candidatus Riflebacteria bacterium]